MDNIAIAYIAMDTKANRKLRELSEIMQRGQMLLSKSSLIQVFYQLHTVYYVQVFILLGFFAFKIF
jgi:hypothetical protein